MFGALESRVRRLCFVCVSFENKAKEQKKGEGGGQLSGRFWGDPSGTLATPAGSTSATVVGASPPVYKGNSMLTPVRLKL